jgi:hypothetical protein
MASSGSYVPVHRGAICRDASAPTRPATTASIDGETVLVIPAIYVALRSGKGAAEEAAKPA